MDLKFSRWLYRHYCLLEKQGQLNLAPEGCNPEAGRPIGSMLATSNHEVDLDLLHCAVYSKAHITLRHGSSTEDIISSKTGSPMEAVILSSLLKL